MSGPSGIDNIADIDRSPYGRSMSSEGYKPGTTRGGLCGCLAAAFVGLPLASFVLLVSSLGDCVPDVPCKHGIIWSLMLPSITIATAVGFATRWAVNWFIDRRGSDS